MGTINHINAARKNTFIGMECEREHVKKDENAFPPWLRKKSVEKVDPYTRRRNICDVCHTTKALQTGACMCD